MSFYCCQIEFASPDYDAAFRIREKLLRIPLNLEFQVNDVIEEYLEFHFAIFNHLDEMLGTVILQPKSDPGILKLRQMAILQEYQGKALGKQLVSCTEKWARSNNYKRIELHARKTAIGFYEKLGYSVVGKEFTEVNIPHRKMVKEISP